MRIIVAVLFVALSFPAWAKPGVATVSEAKPSAVIKKPKLLRSNPHRYTAINFAGVDPWDAVDDEDIMPQRRYRFKLEPNDSDEVSDYIKIRLLIARTKALKKFVEAHSDTV
jgi:hypothetical protein